MTRIRMDTRQMIIAAALLFAPFMCLQNGCSNSKERHELDLREDSLNARDSILSLREAQLAEREAQLIAEEDRIDSLKGLEQSLVYDSLAIGSWEADMVCSSTTCEGSAVGDESSALWTMAYSGDTLVISSFQSGKLARSYRGYTDTSGVHAAGIVPDSTATMSITLHHVSPNKMEGTRTIDRSSGCETVYDVELNRAS